MTGIEDSGCCSCLRTCYGPHKLLIDRQRLEFTNISALRSGSPLRHFLLLWSWSTCFTHLRPLAKP